jgi:hypothetical protein
MWAGGKDLDLWYGFIPLPLSLVPWKLRGRNLWDEREDWTSELFVVFSLYLG